MFSDCTKHASAGALFHRQQIFKQNWSVLTDVNLLGLDEASTVAYNSGETQTCIYYYYFFFFFHFSVDSSEILASMWREEGNFEVLKRCYIQTYQLVFFLCHGKAQIFSKTFFFAINRSNWPFLVSNKQNLAPWRNSYIFGLSSTYLIYVKFRVEKCGDLVKEAAELSLVIDIKWDITKLDTVLLHLNWSS